MGSTNRVLASAGILAWLGGAPAAQTSAAQRIDLAAQLAAGKLRAVNRDVTKLDGTPGAVHLSERADNGVAWLESTDFGEGTIEVDVRGRDLLQRSFLGVAFHRRSDASYESVYLRPFNFRAEDPVRHRHATQYMMLPDYDWPRLREQFPDKFESAVDASLAPTDW